MLSPHHCAVVSIRMTLLLKGHPHEKFLSLSPIRQLFETSRKVRLLTDREQLSPSTPPGPCLPSTLTSGNHACGYSEYPLCGLIKPGQGDQMKYSSRFQTRVTGALWVGESGPRNGSLMGMRVAFWAIYCPLLLLAMTPKVNKSLQTPCRSHNR